MPLSEREERILQELEQRLYEEDPDLEGSLRTPSSRRLSDLTGVRLGMGALAAGILCLIAFFATQSVLLGVLAFAALVGGIVLLAGGIRERSRADVVSLETPKERVQRWRSDVRRRLDRS